MAETVRNSNGSEGKVILSSPLQLKGLISYTDKCPPRKLHSMQDLPPERHQNAAQGTASQGMHMWTAVLSENLSKDEELL